MTDEERRLHRLMDSMERQLQQDHVDIQRLWRRTPQSPQTFAGSSNFGSAASNQGWASTNCAKQDSMLVAFVGDVADALRHSGWASAPYDGSELYPSNFFQFLRDFQGVPTTLPFQTNPTYLTSSGSVDSWRNDYGRAIYCESVHTASVSSDPVYVDYYDTTYPKLTMLSYGSANRAAAATDAANGYPDSYLLRGGSVTASWLIRTTMATGSNVTAADILAGDFIQVSGSSLSQMSMGSNLRKWQSLDDRSRHCDFCSVNSSVQLQAPFLVSPPDESGGTSWEVEAFGSTHAGYCSTSFLSSVSGGFTMTGTWPVVSEEWTPGGGSVKAVMYRQPHSSLFVAGSATEQDIRNSTSTSAEWRPSSLSLPWTPSSKLSNGYPYPALISVKDEFRRGTLLKFMFQKVENSKLHGWTVATYWHPFTRFQKGKSETFTLVQGGFGPDRDFVRAAAYDYLTDSLNFSGTEPAVGDAGTANGRPPRSLTSGYAMYLPPFLTVKRIT